MSEISDDRLKELINVEFWCGSPEVPILARECIRLRKEHAAMRERLEESEEVRTDEAGVLFWTSCGEPVGR